MACGDGRAMTRTACAFVLIFTAAAILPTVAESASDAGWEHLKYRTGWIFLGDLRVDSGSWGTQTKHRTRERSRGQSGVVPVPGDVLEITAPLDVVILKYSTVGEQYRLKSPAREAIHPGDLTGVRLPAGALVRVVEVRRSHRVGAFQSIWARVVPSENRAPP